MKYTITSITDSEETAKAMNLYIIKAMGEHVDSYYMTYHRILVSGSLVRQTDLFLLELFTIDNLGSRAEGIYAAEKWITLGKRTLLISGSAFASDIQSPIYWDLAANDELRDRITSVLESPLSRLSDLDLVREWYYKYYRPAIDPHCVQTGK